jgi:hypothetical protein
MRTENLLVTLSLLALPGLCLAAPDSVGDTVPEPETFALLAGAAVAWAVVRWIRRK